MRKRVLVFGLLAVWLVALLSGGVSAASDEVASLTYTVDVDTRARCYVTVAAEVTCTTAPTQIVFPLHADASGISATGGDYKKKTYDGVKCVVFRSEAGFSGTQNFTCTYSLPCSAAEQATGDLFSLDILPRGWDFPVRKLTVTMNFPSEVASAPTWSSAYYGDVIDNYLRIDISEMTVTATSTTALKDHETLSVQMLCADGFFALRNQPGKTVVVDRVLFWILAAAAFGYWFLRLRSRWIFPKNQQNFSPEATAGELVCQLYGQRPDPAAMLATWGALGYVSISRDARERILLKKEMDMGTERKPAERKLFEAIFAHGAVCDAQSRRFRAAYRSSAAALRRAWSQRMFRRRSGSPYVLRFLAAMTGFVLGFMCFDVLLPASALRWLLLPLLSALCALACLPIQMAGASAMRRRRLPRLLFGLAAAVVLTLVAAQADLAPLALICALLQALSGLVTTFGGRRSPIGRETVALLLGLRRYLRRLDRETMRRISASDGQFFYRLLPFAEVMGVGASFAKRCPDAPGEPCAWLTDARTNPATAKDFYRLYCEIASAVRAEPYGRITGLSGETPQPHRRARKPMPEYYEEEV